MSELSSGDGIELPMDVRDQLGRPVRIRSCENELVKIFRAPTADIEVWKVENSKRLWTIHHETYAFCAVDRWRDNQEQSWSYRRNTYAMDTSSVMLIEPGELHVTHRLPTSDFRVLLVTPSKVQALSGGQQSSLPHFRTGQQEGSELVRRLWRACRAVEAQAGNESGGDELMVDQTLLGFLEHSMQLAGESPVARRATCQKGVKLARAFIHDNYDRNLCLAQLASVAGLSAFHLLRSFRREAGLPPAQYLRRVRLGRALALLRAGAAPSVVATAVGFRTQSGMTRAFNEAYGFAPGYFKKAGVDP